MSEQVDIPQGVLAILTQQGIQASQQLMAETMGNIQSSANVVRHAAAKKFDEIGGIEARSAGSVLNVPLGSPTTP
tara:strand:- start:72 stop:296 length:225 start_codon:yes stop_codon:yes gene_type:complete